MSCSCSVPSTVLQGVGSIQVAGSGTPTDPWQVSEADSGALRFEVRDTATVNMTLFGSGLPGDPIVISADTSSASSLRGLADVATNPVFTQGAVPLWIGSAAGGHFEARTPGTRYTTNATRGSGLYQGEVIKETDTGKRFEWDGSQYVSLDPAQAPTFTLDPSVVQNAGTLDPSTDWNSLTARSGIYRINTFNSNVNGPTGSWNYGTLVVFISGLSVTQTYYEHQGSQFIWQRTKFGSSDWALWSRQYTGIEGNNLATRVSGLEQGQGYYIPGNKMQNGFQNGNWTNRIIKDGPTATLVFNMFSNYTINVSAPNSGAVMLLDSGYRPFMPHDFHASNGGYGTVAMALDPDGFLRIRGGQVNAGSYIYGTVTFILA